jgi:hypothetical protein
MKTMTTWMIIQNQFSFWGETKRRAIARPAEFPEETHKLRRTPRVKKKNSRERVSIFEVLPVVYSPAPYCEDTCWDIGREDRGGEGRGIRWIEGGNQQTNPIHTFIHNEGVTQRYTYKKCSTCRHRCIIKKWRQLIILQPQSEQPDISFTIKSFQSNEM